MPGLARADHSQIKWSEPLVSSRSRRRALPPPSLTRFLAWFMVLLFEKLIEIPLRHWVFGSPWEQPSAYAIDLATITVAAIIIPWVVEPRLSTVTISVQGVNQEFKGHGRERLHIPWSAISKGEIIEARKRHWLVLFDADNQEIARFALAKVDPDKVLRLVQGFKGSPSAPTAEAVDIYRPQS
jgi:hypothetical protein